MSADGSRLFGSQWNANRVAAVRTDPLRLTGFCATGGTGACALDVSPDGRRVVVSHSESDDAAVIDADALVVQALLPVGRFPFSAVRITDDGKWALVAADNAGWLAVLDLDRVEVAGTVATGRIPHVITAGPDGRYYVSNTGEDTVSVVRRTGRQECRFEALYGAE
jgi:DNA-binding beta-propeller fold protein YncE